MKYVPPPSDYTVIHGLEDGLYTPRACRIVFVIPYRTYTVTVRLYGTVKPCMYVQNGKVKVAGLG